MLAVVLVSMQHSFVVNLRLHLGFLLFKCFKYLLVKSQMSNMLSLLLIWHNANS